MGAKATSARRNGACEEVAKSRRNGDDVEPAVSIDVSDCRCRLGVRPKRRPERS